MGGRAGKNGSLEHSGIQQSTKHDSCESPEESGDPEFQHLSRMTLYPKAKCHKLTFIAHAAAGALVPSLKFAQSDPAVDRRSLHHTMEHTP